MPDFEINLDPFIEAAGDNAKKFVVGFALAMQARIQQRTPVLTGRLRASIQPLEPLGDWDAGESIDIGTNVEYARRIEYGFTGTDSLGRHYHQVGRAMFAQAAAEADDIAAQVLRNLGSGGGGTPAPAGGSPSSGGGGGIGAVAEGAAIGAAEGAVEGFIFGGPAGAVGGAVIEAGLGAGEAAVLGNQGGPGQGAAVGAAEGAIWGPAGAVVGAVEGAVEGEVLENQDDQQ